MRFLKFALTDQQTDGPTDRPTDGPIDGPMDGQKNPKEINGHIFKKNTGETKSQNLWMLSMVPLVISPFGADA